MYWMIVFTLLLVTPPFSGIYSCIRCCEISLDDLKYDEKELTEKLGLKHGIPSHDTFSRVFRLINPKTFMQVFIDWTYTYISLVNEHIAIDGKAVRAATEKVEGKNVPYIVNSYVCGQNLVLGQLLIDQKTNEITGISG